MSSNFYIFVDSSKRDNGTNSNFSVLFDSYNMTQQEIGIGLDEAIIPNFAYPIRTGYSSRIAFSEGGPTLYAQIEEGFYDALSFPVALQNALLASGALTYLVTINSVTGKIAIAGSGPFTLNISASDQGIAKLIGFSNSYNSTASTHTGDYPMRLDGPEYVYVEIMNVSNDNMVSGYNASSVLDMIPLNVNFGDIVYYRANDTSNFSLSLMENLQELRVRIRDADGYDFQLPENCNVILKLRCVSNIMDLP